ncbi:MAG: DUF5017 domain-containing protein [Bacteroidetes bacterium]|nr:DUF5017 domain-containing protein [Bacteroidota bacterium]
MKTFKLKIIGLFILLAVISLSSCKKDIETPPFIEPTFTMPTGATLKTIADFKAFAGTTSKVIDSNCYIRGIVVATDESGNYYKDIVMQDTTGGIDIKLEKYSIYNDYPLGQVLYINCKGLYLSNANGTCSLGYKGGTGLVTIPTIQINAHVFRDKFPGAVPAPVVLNSTTCTDRYINTLVVFNYVNFADAGSVFADPLNVLGGMTPRNFSDTMSTTAIIMRSSTYANFKNNLLPKGNGNVRGILTKYNTSWQFCIRDINDVYGFAPDLSIILKESFAASLGSFTQQSVIGDQVWAWSSYGATVSGYASSVYNANEDWLISPVLDLTHHTNIKFSFQSAMNYGTAGQGMKVYYSTDYSGTGSPASATWTELTCTLSAGGWAWTSSGDIDLSAINSTHAYVAFKYVSGTVSSDVSTWELKNVLIKGTHN